MSAFNYSDTRSYSAVYRRPDGRLRADWIAYDTLAAAMLGPDAGQYLGTREGYVERAPYGPPRLFGTPASESVDLSR